MVIIQLVGTIWTEPCRASNVNVINITIKIIKVINIKLHTATVKTLKSKSQPTEIQVTIIN